MIRNIVTLVAATVVCCAMALPKAAGAQQIQVSVSVEGKKGKIPKEVKGAMCRAALDFLASSFPGTELPSDCIKKIPDAPIHLKAEGIFEGPYTTLSLLLELKNVQENAIIKQKAATINLAGGGGKIKDIAYSGMTLALKDLVPSGWKPPGEAGKETPEPEEKPQLPEKEQGSEQGKEPPKTQGQETEQQVQAAAPAPAEEAQPAAPEKTGLLLAVSEKGALVSIDGKTVGKSPFQVLPTLAPGKHSIAAEKEGFNPYSGTLEMPDAGGSGIFRHDIVLESRSKEKKRGSIARKWWLWTIIGVVIAGGGAAAAAAIVLQEKEEADAIPFPGY
jgi:hypothetical protein